jgi:hypothetical protein
MEQYTPLDKTGTPIGMWKNGVVAHAHRLLQERRGLADLHLRY